MTDSERAVIQNWLEICRAGKVKIGKHVLTPLECVVLAQAIEAIAGDLEVAGNPLTSV